MLPHKSKALIMLLIFTVSAISATAISWQGAAMATPSHLELSLDAGNSQAFYNFTLPPTYYEYIPINVSLGMNVTFLVSSNVAVDIYLMSSNQFSTFNATGSAGYIYHYVGTYSSVNVGPLSTGTYYLVVNNNISTKVANVIYCYVTIPVNIYQSVSSLPAPVGIADYGVLNSSGVLHPYKISYKEAIGYADIFSLSAYNSSPPNGISPYGASLQLNVVLQVNANGEQYEYWLQNVPSFYTNNQTMYMVDNVWNSSSSISYLTNSTINGNGYVYLSGQDEYYGYGTSIQPYSLPLSIELPIAYTYSDKGVNVGFGYSLNGGPVEWYDNVTIPARGVTSASFMVNGYNMTPSGYYDAELVFAGQGSSEATNFTHMNAKLDMRYVLLNSSVMIPPALYGFGSNTKEATDDLQTGLVNGYPTVSIGPGYFGPVGYSTSAPRFSAEIQLTQSPASSGMKVPVSVNSSVSNGVAPYTYYFYVDNTLVYNFSTFSPSYSSTVYLPSLGAGNHTLIVEMADSVGNSMSYSSTLRITPGQATSSYAGALIFALIVIIAAVLIRRRRQDFQMS